MKLVSFSSDERRILLALDRARLAAFPIYSLWAKLSQPTAG